VRKMLSRDITTTLSPTFSLSLSLSLSLSIMIILLLVSNHDPNVMLADSNDDHANVSPREWRVPVVRSAAPYMSDAVDAEGSVQYVYVAYEDGEYTYEPGFVPHVYRYDGRQDEAQSEHDRRIMPETKLHHQGSARGCNGVSSS